MVNAPVPAVLVTLGGAVNVKGPELAVAGLAVLVTVIVPVLVVVFGLPGPEGFNTGEGAEIVSVAPVTWNVGVTVPTVLPPPPPCVNVTVLAESPALLAIAQLAVTVVAVDTTPVQLTLPPLNRTPVTLLRFDPPVAVTVTGTVAPRAPEAGEMVPVPLTTVNVVVAGVVPGVLTVTVCAPRPAPVVIVKVVVSVVPSGLTLVLPATTATPVPLVIVTEAPVRLVPIMVTGTVLPR